MTGGDSGDADLETDCFQEIRIPRRRCVGKHSATENASRLICYKVVIKLHGCDRPNPMPATLCYGREFVMVTLLTALVSLVDAWKQHVGSDYPLETVTDKIDPALGAQMYKMTSDTPTRIIAAALESALTAHSHAAADAAEELAEQYGTKKALMAETTLEAFLSEIWPKPPLTIPTKHSSRTRTTTRLAHKSI
jgi:hypothetical protein